MASKLVRLFLTPMSDLVRGRVTGRLDWRGDITAADLTPEIKSLVLTIIQRTHLWRSEKAALVPEMLAHFFDGLAGGMSGADPIADFGNVRDAARLLRRAKIRNRSFVWNLFERICWLLLLLGIFYSVVGVYYYSGSPTTRVNYIAQMNAHIEQTPLDQRAWPIYQSALLALRGKEAQPILNDSAYGNQWPQMARWIDDHQSAIDSVQRATKLPVLGLSIGGYGSLTSATSPSMVQPTADLNLTNVSLPQLRDLRVLADLLAFDAKRGRELHDGKRVETDIASLAALAAQLRREGKVHVAQLFSLGILDRSFDELDRALVEIPQVFDDATLIRIAHRISIPQVASDLLNVSGERLVFEDVLQRTFTDDGHGDGRFSPRGWSFYQSIFPLDTCGPIELLMGQAPGVVLQPASLLVMGSRKELLNEYRHLMDLNDSTIRVPLREADLNAPYEEWRSLNHSLSSRLHYAPLIPLAPSLHRSAELAERTLGERDGLLVAISLEVYHRRNHSYPDSLDQLTPGLLPEVPADRITGAPVKYRLIGGKPLVYSVGVDRVDDGGLLPTLRETRFDPNAAAVWGDPICGGIPTIVHGDWVLFPRPRLPESDVQKN
jgi:hypothetical protein